MAIGLQHIMVSWQLQFLERFSNDLENAIAKKQDDLMQYFKNEIKKISPDDDESITHFWDFHEDEYHEINVEYPNTFRSAILVICYTILENALVDAYEDYKKNLMKSGKKAEQLGRGKESTISKVKSILEKNMSFPDTPEWKKIDLYRKVRNIVVHNNCKIKKFNNKDDKQVMLIKQVPNLDINNVGRLIFNELFCKEVIHDTQVFLEDFYSQVRKYNKNIK